MFLVDFLLEQNVFILAAIGFAVIALILSIGIAACFSNIKEVGKKSKIIRLIYLVLAAPQVAFLIFWIVVLISYSNGSITTLPL